MKRLSLVCGLIFSLLISACSSYTYHSISNGKVDLNKYSSFAVLPIQQYKKSDRNYYDNSIAEEKLATAITQEFAERGLSLNSNQPELLVKITTGVDKDIRYINDPVYYQPPLRMVPRATYYQGRTIYYYSYYRPMPIYLGTEQRKVEVNENSIVIDLIDKKTSKVIWRGWGEGTVDDAEKVINDIPQVIDKIMKRYRNN